VWRQERWLRALLDAPPPTGPLPADPLTVLRDGPRRATLAFKLGLEPSMCASLCAAQGYHAGVVASGLAALATVAAGGSDVQGAVLLALSATRTAVHTAPTCAPSSLLMEVLLGTIAAAAALPVLAEATAGGVSVSGSAMLAHVLVAVLEASRERAEADGRAETDLPALYATLAPLLLRFAAPVVPRGLLTALREPHLAPLLAVLDARWFFHLSAMS
jgi:hypothetical protein